MKLHKTVEIGQSTLQHVAPRLFLSDRKVLVSKERSSAEFNERVAQGLGSKPDYLPLGREVDTLVFERPSTLLENLYVSYGEKHLKPKGLDRLKDCQKMEGSLRMLDMEKVWGVDSFAHCHYASEQHMLMAFADEDFLSGTILELKVAEDFSLIFANDSYVAWILYCPERYIAEQFEGAPNGSNGRAQYWFERVFNFFDESCYEEMVKKSASTAKSIGQMYQQISTEIGSQTEVEAMILLRDWIWDQFDRYYYGSELYALLNQDGGGASE